MNYQDALEMFEHVTNETPITSNECLITRQPIENEIILKCGHMFEYNALLNNLYTTQQSFNYHSCPYCRCTFQNFIPFYECCQDNITIDERKKTKMFRKNDYLTCQHVFLSGKRKNEYCNKDANQYNIGVFCSFHNKQKTQKKSNNYICLCTKILKNGKTCKNKMYDNETNLCKRHYQQNTS